MVARRISKKIFFICCLFPVVVSAAQLPSRPTRDIFSAVAQNGKKRIEGLNRKLLEHQIPTVERQLGKIPYDIHPRTFIIGSNFYTEGLRILSFIELLEKNEKIEICRESLDSIDEIFYKQLRLLIRRLHIVDFVTKEDWLRLGMKNAVAVTSVPQSHSDELVRTELIDVFTRIYDPHARPASMPEQQKTLVRFVRRVIIGIFRARRADELSEAEQRDFLMHTLDEIGKKIGAECGVTDRAVCSLLASLNVLGLIAIEKKKKFPIKTVLLGVGGVAALILVIWLIKKFALGDGNIGVEPRGSSAELIEMVTKNKGVFVKFQDPVLQLCTTFADHPDKEPGGVSKLMKLCVEKEGLPVSPEVFGEFNASVETACKKFEEVINGSINRLITAGSSIGSGAIGGFFVGGPYGAGIGAIVGGLSETGFRKWWYATKQA